MDAGHLHGSGERARAFAALGLTQGLGSIAGQIVGGLIVSADLWGWRPIFLINVPVGLIALVLAARVLDESKARAQKLDLAGTALSALAVGFLLFPLIQGRELGWPFWMLVMLVLSVPMMLLFIDHQRLKSQSDDAPLMDTRLFGHRAFVLGIAALFLLCTTLFSFFVILAFVLQAGLGLSPLWAAYIFLPLAVTYVIASYVAGRLGGAHARMLLIAGGICLTLGYGAMAAMHQWLAAYPVAFVPGMIWLGVAQGFLSRRCSTPFSAMFRPSTPALPPASPRRCSRRGCIRCRGRRADLLWCRAGDAGRGRGAGHGLHHGVRAGADLQCCGGGRDDRIARGVADAGQGQAAADRVSVPVTAADSRHCDERRGLSRRG